jgi:membrane protease YdiL (CAAX protease family)
MLDNLGIAIASVCLVLGGVLLNLGLTKPDAYQFLTVLGGATLLSLGLISIWLALKRKWEWRKEYKKYRGE